MITLMVPPVMALAHQPMLAERNPYRLIPQPAAWAASQRQELLALIDRVRGVEAQLDRLLAKRRKDIHATHTHLG